ncbi:Bacterial pre-peptidase C-terminal domain family [Synechococcus sp. PCC 7335]|uniref:PPC domain-containing protein n=1 Tax=Synechococcus sp. (strain ATCC 29403 / PCC 7335) TaxID=91464 RepID=UPI00017EB149|nr:PPC domain-containing protein [Synechococcus sp. PCC 7335]EDX83898.1 Bacterial pre-peptidase C-terminal domain family [Synechococcus sp. PCC 7335]
MTLWTAIATTAAFFGLMASSALAQPTGLSNPLSARGALSNVDPRLDDGSFYDRYDFAGRSGEYVTIYLESEDFDPYLILLDPAGERLSENDDISRTNDDSRLVVRLPSTGTYTVLANSYESGSLGQYSIRIDVEEDRESLVRTLTAAALPGSSQTCISAVSAATEEIEASGAVSALVSSLQLSRLYETTPNSRPYGVYLSLSGASTMSFFLSPQFLERLSSDLIESCSSVGAVFFGSSSLQEEKIFGLLLESQSTGAQSWRVEPFVCINGAQSPTSQRTSQRLRWGQQVCSS